MKEAGKKGHVDGLRVPGQGVRLKDQQSLESPDFHTSAYFYGIMCSGPHLLGFRSSVFFPFFQIGFLPTIPLHYFQQKRGVGGKRTDIWTGLLIATTLV